MGRPLRCREPGVYHFSTTRCVESRLFLRPDSALNAVLGYWLARSLREFPAVTLHGFVAMSNHIHLLTRDDDGVLSSFMAYFLGNLAKAVNRLRRRSGPLFHRRFDDGGRILDAHAAVQRLAYLIANPVTAGLVTRHTQWPGVILYGAAEAKVSHYVWFDTVAWTEARRAAPRGARVDPEPFHRRESLTVHPLPFTAPAEGVGLIGGHRLFALDEAASRLVSACAHAAPLDVDRPGASLSALDLVKRLEDEERDRRRASRTSVLGPQRVAAQDPTKRPSETQRSQRPACDACDERLWLAFKKAMTAFAAWYREAAANLRRLERVGPFPPFSLLPGGAPAT